MRYKNISCFISLKKNAQIISASVMSVLGNCKVIEYDENREYKKSSIDCDTDLIIIFGGDGFLLNIIHQLIKNGVLRERQIPIYGINCGTVGYLLNRYNAQYLEKSIDKAEAIFFNPLIAEVVTYEEIVHTMYAINEVTVFRGNYQAAHMFIKMNNIPREQFLIADGISLATPIGSSAYNRALGGPMLPIDCNMLSLCSINPLNPSDWKGMVLKDSNEISINIPNINKRPVNVTADSEGIENVKSVKIRKYDRIKITLLFNYRFSIEDKRIKELFPRKIIPMHN